MTENQLLERFVATGDEEAFEGLVRRHGPMVLGICREILRDRHEAEDVFQSTFLALVKGAGAIRKKESIASWLYGVARRLALKAKGRKTRTVLVEHGDSMAAVDTATGFEQDEIRPILHEEVGRLPEKYRSPVVLCYFEGQTHEEAATQLQWPVGTVKGRLTRARETLQTRLARRGIALGMGLVGFLESSDLRAEVPEALVETTVTSAARRRPVPDARAAEPARWQPWAVGALVLVAFLLGWVARSGALAAFRPIRRDAVEARPVRIDGAAGHACNGDDR
jgi:RNA polymerase sigma factor (sigma-70 family)